MSASFQDAYLKPKSEEEEEDNWEEARQECSGDARRDSGRYFRHIHTHTVKSSRWRESKASLYFRYTQTIQLSHTMNTHCNPSTPQSTT